MKTKFLKEINWLIRDKYQGRQPDPRLLKQDLARLAKDEPLDYIIGWRDFLGCRIDLTAHPLIPREETEFWTKRAIKEIKGGECLDLFAGSGCVGLAVLKNCPRTKMTFGEKDIKFIWQIKKNLKLNNINPARVRVVQTDVFSKIAGQFDYIFANPPYIPRNYRARVQPSVLKWEPATALFSGPDGLFLITKFLKEAQKHLKPGGKIFLEFGQGQKLAITQLLKDFDYSSFEFRKDQFDKWRYVIIK